MECSHGWSEASVLAGGAQPVEAVAIDKCDPGTGAALRPSRASTIRLISLSAPAVPPAREVRNEAFARMMAEEQDHETLAGIQESGARLAVRASLVTYYTLFLSAFPTIPHFGNEIGSVIPSEDFNHLHCPLRDPPYRRPQKALLDSFT